MDHLVTSRSKSDEICVDSVRDDNLLLYIEAVRTSETVGVPKIVFHYDVEKLDPAVVADPMEGETTKPPLVYSHYNFRVFILSQYSKMEIINIQYYIITQI